LREYGVPSSDLPTNLVYQLSIPTVPNFVNGGVTYAIDNSASIAAGSYSRVGYLLELGDGVNPNKWVYVSMDAFDNTASNLKIPLTASASHQMYVTNVNAYSSQPNVATTSSVTGFIEMWNLNYVQASNYQVPGSSTTTFDTSDTPATGGQYGSFQVHSYNTNTVLFAFNRWGDSSGNCDIGIGSQSSGNPDWTFSQTCGNFKLMRLSAFVGGGAFNLGTPQTLVDEFESYSLVYDLTSIPSSPSYLNGPVQYAVDNSKSTKSFTRVAYLLELGSFTTPSEFVWVSFPAVAGTTATQLGLPTVSGGQQFAQMVSGINVYSNNPSVVTGKGITTGNLEIWPSNYGPANVNSIPGASASTFDFGDQQTTGGNYGSFQIHNYKAGQTLIAFNAFNDPRVCDIGIGNSLGANPDWTFSGSCSNFLYRRLRVFAQ